MHLEKAARGWLRKIRKNIGPRIATTQAAAVRPATGRLCVCLVNRARSARVIFLRLAPLRFGNTAVEGLLTSVAFVSYGPQAVGTIG